MTFSTACKFSKTPVLRLSGLCKDSPLDRTYSLLEPTPDMEAMGIEERLPGQRVGLYSFQPRRTHG